MAVQNKISEILITYLRKYRRVAIRGIGAFQIEEVSARIDEETNTLLPPRETVQLFKATESESFLTEMLTEPAELAEVADYLAIVQRELATTDQFRIAGFGKLFREGGKLCFDPDEALEAKVSHRLPIVTLPKPKYQTTAALKPPKKKVEKLYIDKGPDKTWSHYILPLAIVAAGICAMALLYRACDAAEEQQEMVNTISAEQETAGAEGQKGAGLYDSLLTNEVLELGCQISIGSYREMDNARSQLYRAQNMGYEAKLISFHNGTRVVVVFPCTEHDLLDYLREVQTNLSADAWYLVPSVDQEDLLKLKED